MRNKLLTILCSVLFLSCTEAERDEDRTFFLQGVWLLSHRETSIGSVTSYSLHDEGTTCYLFDRDSMLYKCRLMATSSGLVVAPREQVQVTLVDKGGGDLLYLEGDDPHPLTASGDTAITIQYHGTLFEWVRNDDIYHEWGRDIRAIVAAETADQYSSATCYVLSQKERRQEKTIQWGAVFFAVVVLAVLLAGHLAIVGRRERRRLQLELQRIQDVQEHRAQAVRQAAQTVESGFFISDDYASLRRRMAEGSTLRSQDWDDVERKLNAVYPGFSVQLRSLFPMSELEYQVCLLVKLRVPPKDIATVLARDTSTISTVRSRLYKKVFGRKGGAKEWDDFILSIES